MPPPRRRPEDSEDFAIERSPRHTPANVGCWIAVGCGLLTLGLFASLCVGAAAYYVWIYDLTNTTWHGTENLPGFGPLTFEFKKGNVVIMTDAAVALKGPVTGTWTRARSNVTLRFANCEYRGVISGNVMTGTAQFTDLRFGRRDPQPWSFTVTRN